MTRLGFAAAATGYLVAVAIFAWGIDRFPGDVLVWDRVGDEIRAGASPYYPIAPGTGPGAWYYAPPLAVALALVTWIPVWMQAVLLLVANLGAVRYLVGSWVRVGWCLLFPILELELIGGQVNLLMGAALLAAVRGAPAGAIVAAAAKLAPILAVDPRQWRHVLVVGAMLVLVTLPVLELWPAWVRQVTSVYGANVAPGSQILVPFLPRLAVGLALVAYGRPWSRMAGAIIAIPAIYIGPTLLLLAAVPWPRPRFGRFSIAPARATS